jgi:CelD/BcsL family acetyltransferase involved in cellulose biosynthesis
LNGRLVGILPLVISRYRGLPIRRVSFLGAPLSDYQDLLALPEHRAACRDAFLKHLERHADRWDLIDLTDVPAEGALAGAPLRPGWKMAHHRICPFVPLPDRWETYRATLGKNLRANLGRKRRKLEHELSAQLEIVGESEVAPTLEALFELHDRRWQQRGLRGAFADAAVRRVHRRAARLFQQRGWLRLHRLTTGGTTRAVYYCFQRAGRIYYYLSGFDLALERHSIGSVLLGQVIASGIGEGAHELDFLRGDESYKYEWNAVDRRTVRMVVCKPTLRSSAGLAVNRVERELEQLGSQLRNRLWGRRPAPGARSVEPARVAGDEHRADVQRTGRLAKRARGGV